MSLGTARASAARGGHSSGMAEKAAWPQQAQKEGKEEGLQMGEDEETTPGALARAFCSKNRAHFLHFIHCCRYPVLQLLPTQKQPHSSNQQLMSQGDGWSENTSEAVRVCQHKSNKNPSLGLHPPPQTQVMALFLIPRGRAHPVKSPTGLPRLPWNHLPFKPITIEKLKKKRKYKNIK